MTEIVLERLRRVEVAFGERVGTAREGGPAIDDRHRDKVVAIARAADVASGLVLDDANARGRVEIAAVVGELPAHESDDRAIDLDRVDRASSVDQCVLDVDATARS